MNHIVAPEWPLLKPPQLPDEPASMPMSLAPAAVCESRRVPGLIVSSWLALRLAWRQLRHEKTRLASAIGGVLFASVLVFMQLGFRGALFESATKLVGVLRADLFLVHPLTVASHHPETMPRVRAQQALALPEVERAVPIYVAQANWRNPLDGTRRPIQLIGVDTEAGVMDIQGLDPLVNRLKRADTVAFDRRSRPEFGPVAQLLTDHHGSIEVEIGGRRMKVVGLVEIGPSFAADGNVVLSEVNFRRVARASNASAVDLVAIRLRAGADIRAAQAQLRAIMPRDVRVLTQAELNEREHRHWDESTPIGFIFAFGSLMGLVVGVMIVYQILFSDIVGHLEEYATLKAMGYSCFYLGRVVLGAALILAVGGFVPGLLLSMLLYDAVGAATLLPLRLSASMGGGVFMLILAMCVTAGLLALRKLRDADPAEMF